MAKQKGICLECGKEYEYEYNPKFPRKYCPDCSAAKKQAFEDNQPVPVVKPGFTGMGQSEKPGTPTNKEILAMSKPKATNGNPYAKDPVGLAVEIFCALINKETAREEIKPHPFMDIAIELVKQAQEAFS